MARLWVQTIHCLGVILAFTGVSSREIRCRTEGKWRLDFDRERRVHCGTSDYFWKH